MAGCCNGPKRPPLTIVYLFCRLFWACWCIDQRRFSLTWCYYDVTVNTEPEGNDNRSTCVWPDGPMWWKRWAPCFCIQVLGCLGSAFVVSGSVFLKSICLYLCEWALSPSDCWSSPVQPLAWATMQLFFFSPAYDLEWYDDNSAHMLVLLIFRRIIIPASVLDGCTRGRDLNPPKSRRRASWCLNQWQAIF